MESSIKVILEPKSKGLSDCPGYKFAATSVDIRDNKSSQLDLAIIVGDKSLKSAGVFTLNDVKAAPVVLSMNVLEESAESIGGIVINSGNANACTGHQGLADAKEMSTSAQVCSNIGFPFYVCSTGRIGRKLPINKICEGIDTCSKALNNSEANSEDVAKAILTSDTLIKQETARIIYNDQTFTIAGIAKGAGMIDPNMATMLAFIVTDLDGTHINLQKSLSQANSKSFNSISIDGDMSTNDTVLLLANGDAEVDFSCDKNLQKAFDQALEKVCHNLAQKIVSDGEKITKVVTLKIQGCTSTQTAEKIARSIGTSLLVKTSFYGSDPNWGRIVDAAGYAKAGININKLDLDYETIPVLRAGIPQEHHAKQWKEIVSKKNFSIHLNLNQGSSKYTFTTTDLSEAYVTFNKSE